MFQAFWMGIPCCVSRRAAPGLETWMTLNGPSHMGESLCNLSLERTRLRTRSPTSSVLERTLRQWYRRSACWYLATLNAASRRRSSPNTRSIPRVASCCTSSNARTRAERCLTS